MLIVASLFFGMGEAGGYPNATGTLSRWFPKAERARAVGIVWTAARIGGALASVMVVRILKVYGWRTPFFLFAGTGVVWAMAWYAWYRDDPAQKKGVSQSELEEIRQPAKTIEAEVPRGLWCCENRNVQYLMAMYFAYLFGSLFLSVVASYLPRERPWIQSGENGSLVFITLHLGCLRESNWRHNERLSRKGNMG